MEQKQDRMTSRYEIDLERIFSALKKNAASILVTAVAAAVVCFGCAAWLVTPKYHARAMF